MEGDERRNRTRSLTPCLQPRQRLTKNTFEVELWLLRILNGKNFRHPTLHPSTTSNDRDLCGEYRTSQKANIIFSTTGKKFSEKPFFFLAQFFYDSIFEMGWKMVKCKWTVKSVNYSYVNGRHLSRTLRPLTRLNRAYMELPQVRMDKTYGKWASYVPIHQLGNVIGVQQQPLELSCLFGSMNP